MGTVDTARCHACGRVYARASKPRWLFTQEGRPIGTVHTSCPVGGHVLGLEVKHSLDDAQFWAWVWTLPSGPHPERETDLWYARQLVDYPLSETLNERQRHRLGWWQDGPMALPPERIAPIKDAYRALVAQFRAWQASLEGAA